MYCRVSHRRQPTASFNPRPRARGRRRGLQRCRDACDHIVSTRAPVRGGDKRLTDVNVMLLEVSTRAPVRGGDAGAMV